ncbi:guanylate kinase-like protein [Dermatophagoides farinae]|uniref:Guanylate kinase-like protein n=1 Tax=Dermatophagoides farinae TaxID=6954 RepID=A0A9D4P542_DERFA|nr:guanylate kinase-like protein [Dermatophagoides farinae]
MSQTYQHSNYCNNHSINNSLNHDNKIINAIVVCGPSGSGKTTLLNLLFEHFKDKLKFSISHTTRKSRPNEVNGKSYYFVDRPTFEQMIANNEFVEYSQFSGNYYGTSIQELITNEKKKDILKAKYIFVKPPSLQFLEMNLRNRGTENDDSISVRLKHAAEDLKQAETIHFDLILENFVLKNSFEKLRQFVQSELTRFNESHRHRE